MEILSIYACIAAGLTASLVLHRYVYVCFQYTFSKQVLSLLFRRKPRPYLIGRRHWLDPISTSRMLLHVAHLAGTLVCNCIGVRNSFDAGSRAASIALIHLVPLLLSRHFGLAADFFGIPVTSYKRLHQGLGFMTVVQLVIHVILQYRDTMFDLHDRIFRYGFLGGVILVSLFIVSLPCVRGMAYDTFMHMHFLLSIVTMAMVFLHIRRLRKLHVICFIVSAGFLACTSTFHAGAVAFRNILASRPIQKVSLTERKGAIELTFKPTRPWKIVPGQYVNLIARGIGLRSLLHARPFQIIWWERDRDGNIESISILVKIKNTGISNTLSRAAKLHRELKVLVDGPYGRHSQESIWGKMGSYNTVVLLATGIGIAAQLPYARELLGRFIREQTSISGSGAPLSRRRIALVWEVEESDYQEWVAAWTTRLLAEDDSTMILHYFVSIINGSASQKRNKSPGRRVNISYGRANIKSILKNEEDSQPDRTLVAVSAHPAFRDAVRDVVLDSKKLDLEELEYQPSKENPWIPGSSA